MKKLDFVYDPDKTGDDAVNVSDKKRRKKFDIFPKFICLLIAIVVWLWMVNLNDTDATETKVLKIDYIGMHDVADGYVMFYDMDKTEITVTVKGSNRDLKKYSDSEYSATVDVSDLTAENIVPGEKITLPINVKVPEDSSLKVTESNAINVSMYADVYVSKEVNFEVMVEKDNDDTNTYEKLIAIDGDIQNKNVITISGPSKLVDLISRARYTINSNLLTRPVLGGFLDRKEFKGSESKFPLTFMDDDYSVVNETNRLIDYSTENIGVLVKVIAHKEVPVRVNVTGVGSELMAHTNPMTIKISGAPSVLKEIDEYPVEMSDVNIGIVYVRLIDIPSEWISKDVTIENAEKQMQIDFSNSTN